jgi:hypothetical protein
MNDEERAAIQAVRDIPDISLPDVSMESPLDAHDILDGSVTVDLSHYAGELRQILEDDAEDDDGWCVHHKRYIGSRFNISFSSVKPPRMDPQTRRDQLNRRNEGFQQQLTGITQAYLSWHAGLGEAGYNTPPCVVPTGSKVEEVHRLLVLDVFSKSFNIKPRQFTIKYIN